MVHSLQNHLAQAFMAMLLASILGGHSERFIVAPLRRAYQRLFHRVEIKLNRNRRSRKARAFRGLVLLILSVFLAYLFAILISHFSKELPTGWLLELLLLALLLPVRAPLTMARIICSKLSNNDLRAACKIVRHIAWRDSAVLDLHGVARMTIESLPVHFTTRVVSPLLWYIALGFPAFLICRQITMLSRLFAHPSPRYEAFGWFITQSSRVLHFLPALFATSICVIGAFFIPKGHPLKALRQALSASDSFATNYLLKVIGATAGALDVSLVGPYAHHGHFIEASWIGTGSAKAAVVDIKHVTILYAVESGLLTLCMAIALTM